MLIGLHRARTGVISGGAVVMAADSLAGGRAAPVRAVEAGPR